MNKAKLLYKIYIKQVNIYTGMTNVLQLESVAWLFVSECSVLLECMLVGEFFAVCRIAI